MLIYHIVLPDAWAQIEDKEFYRAESLEAEGFIHCSFAEQLEKVLQRYYAGKEKVLILTIETEKKEKKKKKGFLGKYGVFIFFLKIFLPEKPPQPLKPRVLFNSKCTKI